MQSEVLLIVSPPMAVTGSIHDIDNESGRCGDPFSPQHSAPPNSVESSASFKLISSKSKPLNSSNPYSLAKTSSKGESENTGGEFESCGGDNVVELDGEIPVPELPWGENPFITEDTQLGENVGPLLQGEGCLTCPCGE